MDCVPGGRRGVVLTADPMAPRLATVLDGGPRSSGPLDWSAGDHWWPTVLTGDADTLGRVSNVSP